MTTVIIDGYKFKKDERSGYYLSSKIINGKRPRLHRYVWEKANGPIPEGFHVHHKDHDKDNNDLSNLIVIAGREHSKYHSNNLTEEQEAARAANGRLRVEHDMKEWHGTTQGKEWHKKHFENTLKKFVEPTIKRSCAVCEAEFMTSEALVDRAKYCSNKCKSTARRRSGADHIEKNCVHCGKPFTSNKYSSAKYCSTLCRKSRKKGRG